MPEGARMMLGSEPYNRNNYEINEQGKLQMYNYIKDNDSDRLRDLCESQEEVIHGISQIFFDFEETDKEVINLTEEYKVTVSILNPVLLCLKHQSL